MKSVSSSLLLGLLSLLTLGAFAQKRNDKQASERVTAFTPEEQLKRFRLAPGFTIELVASEREGVIKPIDLAFNDAGDLWTQTAVMYPLDPISDIQWNDLLELMDNQEKQGEHPAFRRVSDLYRGVTQGEDKIIKLSGLYDAKLTTHVWADGLAIPMSILPSKNSVYVAQGSEIFLLSDQNEDGVADVRTPLFTGFGFTDTHTMTHLLRKGPGGWIHFSHGALNKGLVSSYIDQTVKTRFDYSKTGRFRPNGKSIEVLTSGLNNIWGYTLRANGQWFGSEANDLGYSVVPLEQSTAFPGIGGEKFRPYQPMYPAIHSFRVGGTGLSGLAFSEDEPGSFPEPWRNVAFLANPITNAINAVRIEQNPDGSIRSEHLGNLLESDDDWFRPVNIVFGPDGCLYIADWYNKIVSHNEVPTTHPDRDKKHGRIWRIRPAGQASRKVVDFYKVPTQQLPDYIKSPYLWERRAAWNQISERELRVTKELIPSLSAMVDNQELPGSVRVHALWSLEALGYFQEASFRRWLADSDDDVRRETLRFLSAYPEKITAFNTSFHRLTKDANASVRSQLIRTLGSIVEPSEETVALLLEMCGPELPGEEVGGAYERKFERYLVRKVLENWPARLEKYLNGKKMQEFPNTDVLWAIQALSVDQRASHFFTHSQLPTEGKLAERSFLDLAEMASNPEAKRKLKSYLEASGTSETYLRYALKYQTQINSPEVRALLVQPAISALKSDNLPENRLALETIVAFGLEVADQPIIDVMHATSDERLLSWAVSALDAVRTQRSEPYFRLIDNVQLSHTLRMSALQGGLRTDRKRGKEAVQSWIATLDAVAVRTLTNALSRHAIGVGLLLELYGERTLKPEDFEVMTAERVHSLATDKTKAADLLEAIMKEEAVRKRAVNERIRSLVTLANAERGDIRKGEMLFQTCLTCHKVGSKGQSIAPSLDGLGYRDTEGLLYAVLDPDAAIEAGYSIFRVIKKDDSVLDGYLVRRDASGTTLAFMGGAELHVPAHEIKSQYQVRGKSFMPTGLFDNLGTQELVDILTYIRTLK
jgi:putative membrane-bound dehydrogenase-like protein